MATIQKRNGSYIIRVSCGYDVNGKQIRQSMTWTPPPNMTKKQTEKELVRQATLFEESVKNGQVINSSMKFETIAEEWLAQIIREGSLKQSTIERYETVKSRVYDAFGHMKICNIKAMHIQRFINNLAEKELNGKGMSTKSQALHLIFISDVFNYAIRYGIIASNPCRNVRTIKKAVKERECYTLAEAQTLLEKLEFAEPKYRTFFTLAIYTGFRRGELLGLEWKDIDLDAGIITINRVSQYLKGGITAGTPKTTQSQRSLKVPDEIVDLLKWYKREQAQERLKVGDKWQNTDRLFTKWDGTPMYPNTPGEWFKSFCKKYNLKYVTVHSFRHLNATLLISNGVDIKTVSKALGHSQTSTTLNIYAHSFAEQQARASEAIANALRIREKDA